MNLLAFDTATSTCSVALWRDGQVVEEYTLAPRQQGHLLLPMIERVLAEQAITREQLDAVAFGCGPGSFTGLRIAASVAQGIALGLSLPVLPISTLAALAQGAYRQHGVENVMVALDARMHQVYWGQYRLTQETMQACSEEQVLSPGDLPAPSDAAIWHGAGNGWEAYAADFPPWAKEIKLLPVDYPRAQDIACLAYHAWQRGEAVAAEQALPVYIRDKVT
jgi:tRNA threonylcarbamoyladenosine biosynthesis protein TsaB